MIQEYLYEIIALIVILTAIVIYFLTIKFQQEEKNTLENIQEKKQVKKIDIEPSQQAEEIKEEPFALSGQEEGSFGSISHDPFDEKPQEIKLERASQKKFRNKVEVPKHGKISKKHFEEFAGIRILVAEDNLINQKVIAGLLADTGIEITMADDGQMALDILEHNSDFNIILMDAHMPRVDGFQATRIIRSNTKYEHIVVVALSGDTAVDDIKKMKASGMQECLEKPLRMDPLYDVLYAYTKDESHSSEFVEVIMTKELNGDQGLSVCGGDDLFYKDILHEFVQNYASSAQELRELLNQDNVSKADSILLDFIGITANIGADNMRDIALELKEVIKETKEKSYSLLLEEYEQHLDILLRDIKEYIK